MSRTEAAPTIPFAGFRGRVLARALQFGFVRYHRIQLGFVERPRQYERVLTEALWGQLRFGRTVLPPEDAVAECDAFFLSTAVFQRILQWDLRRLGFTGPIVAMDDVVPPEWFLA